MVLKVDDLQVIYRTRGGDVRAIDGVSFDVADGEIMGVAGESGSGKTTLGKSLIRLDSRMRHVGGTVELDGTVLPIDDDRAMNRYRFHEISLVPQYAMSALNPIRRIGEMVRDLLESRGLRYADHAEELARRLDLVGLSTDVLARYPIELSGGMKQRMVIVLSTLLDPSLLIADEVTSALDVSTQRAVATTLVEFRDRGFVRSMMVVTHDVSLVYQIADTIMVMYAGRLAEKASADTIVDGTAHPYTKLLISSLPEVGARYVDRRLEGIPGSPPSLIDPHRAATSGTAAHSPRPSASRNRRSSRSAPDHSVACWKAG